MEISVHARGENLRRTLKDKGLLDFVGDFVRRPMKPFPDNFTPRERTPWGGRNIRERIKAELEIGPGRTPGKSIGEVVGEAWEISPDETFPSRFRIPCDNDELLITLPQLLELFPKEILGKEVEKSCDGWLPVLVKIIDSAENLSVQVHPANDYEGLLAGECGKTECWIITEREEGAGIYLGLAAGATRQGVEALLASGGDLSPLMNFVEVKKGDLFSIPPGIIHAIGKGVTLVEPQSIRRGQSGVTYRFWDWNRKYDESGQSDPNGKPRELHLRRSVEVCNFDGLKGDDLVASLRSKCSQSLEKGGSMIVTLFSCEAFTIDRLLLTTKTLLQIDPAGVFHGLVVVGGKSEILGSGGEKIFLRRGESAIVPARFGAYEIGSVGEACEILKVGYPSSNPL